MRKSVYALLLALAFNLLNCYGAFGGTVNETLGTTTYLYYGGGNTHGSIQSVKNFNLQRAFLTCDEIQLNDLKLRVQYSVKNFKYDDYLKTCKDSGINMIVSFQGKLNYQVVQGKSGKVNPVNDADDPMLESSWADYGELVRQFAIRYADDSHEYLPQANVWQSNDYKNNIPKAGLGLVWAMSDRNEADFLHKWSGAKRTLNQKQNAVGFKVFYESVRSVSKTMRIIMPSNIHPNVDSIQVFLVALQNLYAAAGEEMPRDFYVDFHWYMRNGTSNQDGGTWGITPEQAKAYEHGLKMDALVEKWGLLGWFCTETGYATYEGILDNGQPNGDASMFKQNAPAMQGYDIYHAQAWGTLRILFAWGTCKYFAGVTFWHCRNNFDKGPYYAGGFNYSNWTPKISNIEIGKFKTAYGTYFMENYRQKDVLYAVDLIASTDTVTLVWTDINKFGEFDAKPRQGKLELPNQSPTMTVISPTVFAYTAPATFNLSVNATDSDGHVTRVEFYQNGTLLFTDTQYPYTHTASNLVAGNYNYRVSAYDNNNLSTTINNINVVVTPAPTPTSFTLVAPVNHQFKWSDGTNVKIVGHNSPENILHWLNYPFLDWLYVQGANSIYASVNNKESGKPQISVWKNNNPANGFDTAKVDAMVAYAQYWADKHPKNIVQLVLFEKETLNLWTLQQQKDMITFLAQRFAALNGRIIINTEEADNGWSRLNSLYDHIKLVWSSAIRFLHCNTNQNPWAGNYNTDRIHGLSMQDNISAFHAHIMQEVPKNPHWVAIASEMTGGFQPTDTAKAVTLWNAGGNYNHGVEVYIACCDQTNPASNWYQAYAPVFNKLRQLRDGTGAGGNPPPTTQYPLRYSTTSTRTPNFPLHGASLSAGKIYAYIDVNADIPNRPLKFYYDNVFVNNESGRPYELGGGAGYTVADGQHEVKILNSQNAEVAKATFTVGNIVVPPDPTEEDPVVTPPADTAIFVVEFSSKWTRTPSVIAGNSITISQGSYWVFVREGVGPFTLTLIKNIDDIQYTTIDASPVFDLKASNQYFQRGVPYTVIVKDGTGAIKTIAVTVN